MHGALIMPKSYAKSAAFFAQQGYTVYIPYGPGRLSIAAVDSTAVASIDVAFVVVDVAEATEVVVVVVATAAASTLAAAVVSLVVIVATVGAHASWPS